MPRSVPFGHNNLPAGRPYQWAYMTHEQIAEARRALGQSGARTRVVTSEERERRRTGYREPREQALQEESLYVGGVVPAAQPATDPDHVCTICLNLKAHPVIYRCGHSHCYACIRLWLEQSWKCPLCSSLIKRAPKRSSKEQKQITAQFPTWVAATQVLYSWAGLLFPRPSKRRVVVPSSDESS